jgi:hypothetical protein
MYILKRSWPEIQRTAPMAPRNSELCHMTVRHSETTTSLLTFLQKHGIHDTKWELKHCGLVKKYDIKF